MQSSFYPQSAFYSWSAVHNSLATSNVCNVYFLSRMDKTLSGWKLVGHDNMKNILEQISWKQEKNYCASCVYATSLVSKVLSRAHVPRKVDFGSSEQHSPLHVSFFFLRCFENSHRLVFGYRYNLAFNIQVACTACVEWKRKFWPVS